MLIENNFDLSRQGASVEDAVGFYRGIIDSNKIANYTIQDWGDIQIKYLSDPEGWLGVWMLKADELAVSTIGCRIWNAVYIKDSSCVQSIRPVDIGSYSDAESNEIIRTYLRYPLADASGIPQSLTLAIANLSFQQSLIINGSEVNIRPVTGFYALNGEMKDKGILPFQDEASIQAVKLNDFIIQYNVASGFGFGVDRGASLEQQ